MDQQYSESEVQKISKAYANLVRNVYLIETDMTHEEDRNGHVFNIRLSFDTLQRLTSDTLRKSLISSDLYKKISTILES